MTDLILYLPLLSNHFISGKSGAIQNGRLIMLTITKLPVHTTEGGGRFDERIKLLNYWEQGLAAAQHGAIIVPMKTKVA